MSPLSADQVVTLIVGLLWSPLYQILKSFTGWQDRYAHLAAILFSYVLALGIELVFLPPPLTWQVVLAHGSEIAALSQLAYGQVIKQLMAPPAPAVQGPTPPPASEAGSAKQ